MKIFKWNAILNVEHKNKDVGVEEIPEAVMCEIRSDIANGRTDGISIISEESDTDADVSKVLKEHDNMNCNDIEAEIKSINPDETGTMTYGGAIQDKLERFSIYELLSFCCKKLKLKNLIWDYLAGLIISHYVTEERYRKGTH